MNYIWDLLIRAQQSGIDKRDIQFACASSFSPYMELSLTTLNSRIIEPNVEINPFYRFHEIFGELCDHSCADDEELHEVLFDIVVHFLAELDLMQGMNKREFYIRFIIADLEKGVFGSRVMKKFALFSSTEKEAIGHNLLRLYETGEAVYLLKDLVRKLLCNTILYAKSGRENELLFYLGQERDAAVQSKIELLQELFLPFWYTVELIWDDHVGIIGVEETMRLGETALY